MRIARSLVVLLVMVGLMCGYAQRAVAADVTPVSPVLDRIMAKKELVVGTAASMPPLNMTMKDGQIAGLEIDLARVIAGALGVKLTLKTMNFNDLLPALQAGKLDMVLSGMTITPDRNLKVAFVGPYMATGKSILIKQAIAESMSDPSQINKPDRVLVALKGSTSQTFAEKLFPQAKLLLADDYNQAIAMVRDDKAQAMVADMAICQLAVFRYPEAGLTALGKPITYEPLGIAVPPNDPLLVNLLQNLLNTIDKDGTMDAIAKRWFKDSWWVSQMR